MMGNGLIDVGDAEQRTVSQQRLAAARVARTWQSLGGRLPKNAMHHLEIHTMQTRFKHLATVAAIL